MLELESKISQSDLENIVLEYSTSKSLDMWFDQQINTIREKGDTYGLLSHSVRVSFIAVKLAEYENTPINELLLLARAGILHDMGKTALPTELFSKPAETEEQMLQIRTHVRKSVDIVKIDSLDTAVVIAAHHEFQDNPYCRKLDRKDTPSNLRKLQTFLAIADQTDALLSKRPYKDAWSVGNTQKHLMKLFGNQELVNLAIKARLSILT